MQEENVDLNKEEDLKKGRMHFILSHAYMVFLLAVVGGVVIDFVIPLKIISANIFQPIGLFFIIIGTILIYWAQTASHIVGKKMDNENANFNFSYGPYKYLHNPTYFGLFIMTLGLALVINSPFSILFTILAYAIVSLVFVKKEEKILTKKYGNDYLQYKTKNKNK